MDWTIRVRKKWNEVWRFAIFVAEHFINDDCAYRASALAFTSLLAIVPLMTVGLSLFSSLPVFQALTQPIQNFIFDNFVPATGKIIQNYLLLFTNQVSRLPIWGVVFLFVTAILLMVTIEQAMNRIWRVNKSRQGISAFLLYWAILSLAPILLVLSITASSFVFSLLFIQNTYTPSFLLQILPFLLSLIGFTFLYVVVPNRPIKLKHGLIAGFIAAILFEIAKHSFAYYLSRYNTYELLYGAFATIPIFFIWVYWVWIITLLGAEICYALSVDHKRRPGVPISGFMHALIWLHAMWLKQKEGMGLTIQDLTQSTQQPYLVEIEDMLKVLENRQLIHMACDDRYYLSRDLNEVSLYWLSQHLPYRLPIHSELKHLPEAWQHIFKPNDLILEKSLGLKLSELYEM